MKDWMHAKKKEIENMTFDQANIGVQGVQTR